MSDLLGDTIAGGRTEASVIGRLELTIEGEPIAQARGKLATVNGHAMQFKPKKSRNYESIVRERAINVWNGRPLISGVPIELHARFYKSIPKSWSKRDQQAARDGNLRPLGTPDVSNYIKAVEDGLAGAVFFNDSLIVRIVAEKAYSERPRVEIVVTW